MPAVHRSCPVQPGTASALETWAHLHPGQGRMLINVPSFGNSMPWLAPTSASPVNNPSDWAIKHHVLPKCQCFRLKHKRGLRINVQVHLNSEQSHRDELLSPTARCPSAAPRNRSVGRGCVSEWPAQQGQHPGHLAPCSTLPPSGYSRF